MHRKFLTIIFVFLLCVPVARAQEVRAVPLTAEQSLEIAKIQKVLAEVDILPLDEWLDGFRRDPDPDHEIAVWKKISDAYTYFLKGRDASLEYKREVFKVLVASSMMPREEVAINTGVKLLSGKEVMAIMDLYYVK